MDAYLELEFEYGSHMAPDWDNIPHPYRFFLFKNLFNSGINEKKKNNFRMHIEFKASSENYI